MLKRIVVLLSVLKCKSTDKPGIKTNTKILLSGAGISGIVEMFGVLLQYGVAGLQAVSSGVQFTGPTLVLDTLVSSKLFTAMGQSLLVHSCDNITLSSDYTRHLPSTIYLGISVFRHIPPAIFLGISVPRHLPSTT